MKPNFLILFFQAKQTAFLLCIATVVIQAYVDMTLHFFTQNHAWSQNVASYAGKALFEFFWRDEFTPYPYQDISTHIWILILINYFFQFYRHLLVRFTCTFCLFSSILALHSLTSLLRSMKKVEFSKEKVHSFLLQCKQILTYLLVTIC